MTKQEQIKEYLKKPFEKEDLVIFSSEYEKSETIQESKGKNKKWTTIQVKKQFKGQATIKNIEKDKIEIEFKSYISIPSEINNSYSSRSIWTTKDKLTYVVNHLGSDPFIFQDWNSRINFYQSDIESILYRIGYNKKEKIFKNEKIGEITIPELDWNPTVFNEEGIEVEYQRPFVWTLEEKQILIHSIYNNIEIGKIVLRTRAWNWVEKRLKEGLIEHTTFKQIVDGKQRCKTILEFINNEFPDSQGNFWDDLSFNAQRKFFSFRYITYGELGETATDKDVLNTFMCINHTGKPMSKEHLDFVKSIRL